MRLGWALLALALLAPPRVEAQEAAADAEADAEAAAEAEAEADTEAETDAEAEADTAADTATPPPPKVAVVVVGDPDDHLRALARRVDDALEPTLRRPFDPGLRGALRGEPGEPDDGLDTVRRDRRRLGAGEASDAPVLAALGQRAGALVVGVVRATADGAELVALDVHHAAFYQGALALDAELEPARIARFLARRARAAAHVEAIDPASAAAQTPPDPTPEPEEEDEPDFFEQYWPYMVAAVLLGGMIAAIVATQATEQTTVPVLRFVPGGG